MFLEKKDKEVRRTSEQYKNLEGHEQEEFAPRLNQLQRDREDDRLNVWLDFEGEMDD